MNKYLKIALFVASIAWFSSCEQQPDATPDSSPPVASDQQASTESTTPDNQGELHLLFYGDSITAGYGLELEEAFPALVQAKIDEAGWPVRVTNAGLSGETSSGGLNRIDWILRQPVDVFILELGGNDGLRGISLDLTAKNLQAIIDRVKEANPDVSVVVAGMQIPPNLGQDYTEQFRTLFPELAENNDAVLIPFILDGVAGMKELNFDDGIHPTAEGHAILAETVWNTVRPILESRLDELEGCGVPEDVSAAVEEDCEIDTELF